MKVSMLKAILTASLLVGCGDPETKAQRALEKVEAEWREAGEIFDPKRRLSKYDSAIDSLEKIGTAYGKTNIGGRVAAGRSANGVSISKMKASRDYLKERADCFARPTSECLLPYTGEMIRESIAHSSKSAVTPKQGLAAARTAICDHGFTAADELLESFKINKPFYAEQLVQLAFAANECSRPDETHAAIKAYRKAEPATGRDRISKFLSVLNAAPLEAGWPVMINALEAELESVKLEPSAEAGVRMSLAGTYATAGRPEAAVKHYDKVTGEMNFRPDDSVRRKIASAFYADGNLVQGSLYIPESRGASNELLVISNALDQIAVKADIKIKYGIVQIDDQSDPAETLKPSSAASAPSANETSVPAQRIEARMDELIEKFKSHELRAGANGIDTGYGVIALIYKKNGEDDKAEMALAKAVAARAALVSAQQRQGADNRLAQAQMLLAIEEKAFDAAVAHSQDQTYVNSAVQAYLLRAMTREAELSVVLSAATALNPNSPFQHMRIIVDELTKAGKFDDAVKAIKSIPDNRRTALIWPFIETAAAQGEPKEIEKLVELFQLGEQPNEKFRLQTEKAKAYYAAGDSKQAKRQIRDLFAVGMEIDGKVGRTGIGDAHRSADAASVAFSLGYIDLGLELFTDAPVKSYSALSNAFQSEIDSNDITRVLMAGHDILDNRDQQIVINHAFNYLHEDNTKN